MYSVIISLILGTVTIVAATFFDTDNGSGGFAASEGSINYATGAIDITLATHLCRLRAPLYMLHIHISLPGRRVRLQATTGFLARMHPE